MTQEDTTNQQSKSSTNNNMSPESDDQTVPPAEQKQAPGERDLTQSVEDLFGRVRDVLDPNHTPDLETIEDALAGTSSSSTPVIDPQAKPQFQQNNSPNQPLTVSTSSTSNDMPNLDDNETLGTDHAFKSESDGLAANSDISDSPKSPLAGSTDGKVDLSEWTGFIADLYANKAAPLLDKPIAVTNISDDMPDELDEATPDVAANEPKGWHQAGASDLPVLNDNDPALNGNGQNSDGSEADQHRTAQTDAEEMSTFPEPEANNRPNLPPSAARSPLERLFYDEADFTPESPPSRLVDTTTSEAKENQGDGRIDTPAVDASTPPESPEAITSLMAQRAWLKEADETAASLTPPQGDDADTALESASKQGDQNKPTSPTLLDNSDPKPKGLPRSNVAAQSKQLPLNKAPQGDAPLPKRNGGPPSPSVPMSKPDYDEPPRRWWLIVALLVLLIILLSLVGWLWLQGSLSVPQNLAGLTAPTHTTTLTNTPRPTATLTPMAVPTATPAVEAFLIADAAETPEVVPGGQIVSLISRFPDTGWLAEKKETDGLVSILDTQQEFVHQAFLYAGTFDGQTYYGAFAFDVNLIPRGTRIVDATISLTGLRADQLGQSGEWYLELLPPEVDYRWQQLTYQQVKNADPWFTFETPLTQADLDVGQTNVFQFNEQQLAILEERHLAGTGKLSFRLRGPNDTDFDNLFAWDAGGGAAQRPYRLPKGPELVLHLGPLPAATPTVQQVLITSTPTPENIETAVANSKMLTAEATRIGTVTPLPPNWITPIVVTVTPTAGNEATAEIMAAEATAIALTTGEAIYVVTATATPTYVVITSTPTPLNLQTAAVNSIQETANAGQFGRATPIPRNWVTPVVVTSTPTPLNEATDVAIREESTLRAMAYGLPTATPPNLFTATPSPTLFVVTVAPTPLSIETAAAISRRATAVARQYGTPTPLPTNWVTPIVVTSTPTPANAATASYYQLAYLTTGTPTATPVNYVTATSTAIFTPEGLLFFPTATPTATPVPNQIPSILLNKIVFLSDREGASPQERERAHLLRVTPRIVPQPYFYDPETEQIGRLADIWPYDLATLRDAWSADGRFLTFTADSIRYSQSGSRTDAPAIYWYDTLYDVFEPVTFFGAGIAYDGAWSPTAEHIAFVSNDSGNDEIWWVDRTSEQAYQMTRNEWAWDKHPSWSPDGQYIVFYSNRTGSNQIWIIKRDGTEERMLMPPHGANDWDPVWFKYPDPPPELPQFAGGP